uniref:Reverse transcriptase domain-containing protein n=1 Tax=Tanacetum cinerariifolium TaxID=118510 RepID=A0A6L2M8G5_TANCI|nr:hypothetical protein [Tanacetum cinerariifolium]
MEESEQLWGTVYWRENFDSGSYKESLWFGIVMNLSLGSLGGPMAKWVTVSGNNNGTQDGNIDRSTATLMKVVVFYKGLDIFTRKMFESHGLITKMNAKNAKTTIQDMVDHSKMWHEGALNRKFGGGSKGYYVKEENKIGYQEKSSSLEETLNKFMVESAKRDKENIDLIMEVQASTQATIRNHEASLKNIENRICFHDEELKKQAHIPKAMTIPLGASVSVRPYTIFTSLGLGELAPTKLKVELSGKIVKLPLGIVENILVKKNRKVLEVGESGMEDVSYEPTKYKEPAEEWE